MRFCAVTIRHVDGSSGATRSPALRTTCESSLLSSYHGPKGTIPSAFGRRINRPQVPYDQEEQEHRATEARLSPGYFCLHDWQCRMRHERRVWSRRWRRVARRYGSRSMRARVMTPTNKPTANRSSSIRCCRRR
jgi:hypothetical protein